MDNTEKFSGKAGDYSVGRPAYSEALIDMLYDGQGFSELSQIADIGCGTGIFARQLLERGSTVFGVEPNDDMRRAAEENLAAFKNFHLFSGTAEHTALADNSVDFVTSAQAFHWFDVTAFKTECKRILRPQGKIFLVWNKRDTSAEINILCAQIYSEFCPNFKGFGGGVKKDDERVSEFFNGKFSYEEFDNPIVYDREKFIRRSLSSSYSLTERDEKYSHYLSALGRLFDENCKNGALTIPNKTVVYYGSISDGRRVEKE